jgi:hypothetical protein
MAVETQKPQTLRKPGRAEQSVFPRFAFLSRLFLPVRRVLGHYVFSSLTRRNGEEPPSVRTRICRQSDVREWQQQYLRLFCHHMAIAARCSDLAESR